MTGVDRSIEAMARDAEQFGWVFVELLAYDEPDSDLTTELTLRSLIESASEPEWGDLSSARALAAEVFAGPRGVSSELTSPDETDVRFWRTGGELILLATLSLVWRDDVAMWAARAFSH